MQKNRLKRERESKEDREKEEGGEKS